MGKSNKVALVCQVCGATFYKVPSAITMETRCCSKECRGKVQAERLEQRRRELAKELEDLRTESPEGEAPGYVIESGGKRINIRANECVEV